MRCVPLLTAGVLAAFAATLAACAPRSMATCENESAADTQTRIAACTSAIRDGARGDTLVEAYRRRGEAYGVVGEPARAIQDLSQAIRLNPDDDEALTSRASQRATLGDLAGARSDDAQAVRIHPTTEAYVALADVETQLHDYDAAIGDSAKAIEQKPDSPGAWATQGYAYLGKGEYEVALADFASALRIDPQFVGAVNGKAAAFIRKHDYDAAIAVCSDLLKGDPTSASGLSCRADVYDAKGDYVAALADYGLAIEADPATWLYLRRSSVYLDAGDAAHALADSDKALSLTPRDPTALNNACWVRAVFNTALADALADCQRSLAIRPHDGETIDSLAMVYFRMGRLQDARATYNAALAVDSTQAPSRFMRGVVERRLGDASAGDADLAAAERADPTVPKKFAGYGVTP